MRSYKRYGDSICGHKHFKKNQRNQDFGITYSNDTLTINIIADGHGGSAYTHSHLGSQFACELLLEMFKNYHNYDNFKSSFAKEVLIPFEEDWKKKCIKAYKKDSKNKLNQSDILEKFGTTLLFCVVKDNMLYSGRLGDGNIYLVDSDQVTYPYGKDAVNSSKTSSLCSLEIEINMELQVQPVQDLTVIMSTDGHFDSFANHTSFESSLVELASVFKEENIIEFSRDFKPYFENMSKEGSQDDITCYIIKIK